LPLQDVFHLVRWLYVNYYNVMFRI